MTKTTTIILGVLALVAIGVLGRFIPHLPNMTPLVAVSLIAGRYLGRRYAFVVPILAMLISDAFIGWYSLPVMLSVYGSFAFIGFIGFSKRNETGRISLITTAATGSVLFFLITNAAVWMFGTMYPHTIAGLMMSYLAGVPFFHNMLLGDVAYTLGLVFIIEYVIKEKKLYENLRLAFKD